MRTVLILLSCFAALAVLSVTITLLNSEPRRQQSEPGRYVLHLESGEKKALYLLDSQEGQVWRLRPQEEGEASRYQLDRSRWELVREVP